MRKVQIRRTNETGRSMVEMLGVLAVIGVLSIAGIAGFKSAMTRMHANELLNAAGKRAVVVAGQINLNGNNPSLSDFDTSNVFSEGTFETVVYGETGEAEWTRTDRQFTLSITGVSGRVCEKIQEGIGRDVKNFAPETCDTENLNNVKLTYNNDLSLENLPTPVGCPTGVSMANDGSCSVCKNGNVYLPYNIGHECDTETPFDGCKSNDDCTELGDNYYCNISGSAGIPLSGTCESITSSDYTDASIEGLGTVRKSNKGMSWWAADNWCKAQGKSLIDVGEIQCYYSGTNDPFVNGAPANSAGSCCRGNGQTCDTVWYPYWNSNNTIKSGSETIVNTGYSPIFVNLRKTFGGDFLWTSSSLVTMDAYYLDISAGRVTYSQNDRSMGKSAPSISPLCK